MHAFKDKAISPINYVQRVKAQAIMGTFLTIATSVVEAEAHIAPAQSQKFRRFTAHAILGGRYAEILKWTPLWEERVQTNISETPETHTVAGRLMQIVVVGFGGAIQRKSPQYKKLKLKTFFFTLG
ncbi:hypothetical protein TSTA_108070, partial [Talaromyces stipitatus ATCC 10500]